MFIFIHLILGHLIGDYPLQTNSVYKLKFKGLFGLLVHVLIVVACLIFFSWPYLHLKEMWLFLLFIGLTHLLQDWAKIKLTQKSKHQLFYYLLDQAFHIGFIAVVFLTPLKNLPPPVESTFLVSLYNNNLFILLIIASIVASYNGHFMIILIKNSLSKTETSYSKTEKWYGFIERTLIVGLFFLKLPLTLTITLVIAIMMSRSIFKHLFANKENLNHNFSTLPEAMLSCMLAILFGLLFLFVI